MYSTGVSMVAKPISVSVGRRVMEALTVSAGRDRCNGGR